MHVANRRAATSVHDMIINALEITDIGCHIWQTYVGCIVYADDIILLSASVCRLQKMIDTCVKKGEELCNI